MRGVHPQSLRQQEDEPQKMNHYDFEMGLRPEPRKRTTPKTPTGNPSAKIAAARRCLASASAGGGGGADGKPTVEDRYNDAIANYGAGAHYNESVTYWGTAIYSRQYDLSEMDAPDEEMVAEIAETICADVAERGEGVPPNRVRDIHRGVRSALRKRIEWVQEHQRGGGKHFTPRARKVEPPTHAGHVRNLIGDLKAAADGVEDWVRELSPCWDFIGKPPRTQAAMWFKAMFAPNEKIFAYHQHENGAPGLNIRPAADWVEIVKRGGHVPGDKVVPNPFTGKIGLTVDGKHTYIGKSCLAAFPFLIVEFDDLPLAMQYAFWRGFILQSRLAPALVALTYSGGKSLHGVLHVGCRTLAQWEAARDKVRGMLCTDPEFHTVTGADGKPKIVFPFRADVQAMQSRQGTRIAGMSRADNGAVQELLYLNPAARPGAMWSETPPFADPDAVAGTTLKGGAK